MPSELPRNSPRGSCQGMCLVKGLPGKLTAGAVMDTPDVAADRDGALAPPYPAFATFNSFLTGLGSKPVPPRIDRSLMVGIANGVQTQVLAALREFGFIEDGNQV